MISLAILLGVVGAIATRRPADDNMIDNRLSFIGRAISLASTDPSVGDTLNSGEPVINTGGAPTVSIYNGNSPGLPTSQPNNSDDGGKKEILANLTQAVVKGGELNDKEADNTRNASELRELELDQKSVNESDAIAAETERKAADVESSAQRDAHAIDAEEKRHTNVMNVVEDEKNNNDMDFSQEERLERKKIHNDEREVAHDLALVKEGSQALEDESRLEADRLVTEKAKEQQALQSVRRKYREEDEAINLGHDEVESATMAKKLLAERTGAKKSQQAELCAEENSRDADVPPPIGVAESMPCQAAR